VKKISLEGTPLEHFEKDLQDVLSNKSEILPLFDLYKQLNEAQKENPDYKAVLNEFKDQIEEEIGHRQVNSKLALKNAIAKQAEDIRKEAETQIPDAKKKAEEQKLTFDREDAIFKNLEAKIDEENVDAHMVKLAKSHRDSALEQLS